MRRSLVFALILSFGHASVAMAGRGPRDADFASRGGDPSALLARGQTPLSFARYPLPRADDDTQCLIEPAVRCNHCGYCQCHGH